MLMSCSLSAVLVFDKSLTILGLLQDMYIVYFNETLTLLSCRFLLFNF